MLQFRDDPQAFRAFIEVHRDRVYNLVLKRIQHAPDAEEITQDVFIDVFRKPGAFRGESAVSTWLYRIALNKCIDHIRRRERKESWKRPFTTSTEPADFDHPGVLSEEREMAKILFRALNKLPERQYTAWQLQEMEKLNYKEIADVMNLSVSSVESLLVRARQNLKKILSAMYSELHKK